MGRVREGVVDLSEGGGRVLRTPSGLAGIEGAGEGAGRERVGPLGVGGGIGVGEEERAEKLLVRLGVSEYPLTPGRRVLEVAIVCMGAPLGGVGARSIRTKLLCVGAGVRDATTIVRLIPVPTSADDISHVGASGSIIPTS